MTNDKAGNKGIFNRIQHILETVQEKQNRQDIRVQNAERQVSGLAQKIQTLEQQMAILRAAAMQGK